MASTSTTSATGELCCICLETPPAQDTYALPCTHTLCTACLQAVAGRVAGSGVQPQCPQCAAAFAPHAAVPVLDAVDTLDMVCFDTSTSMWYSDGGLLGLGLFGWSRLRVAQEMACALMAMRHADHVRTGRQYHVGVCRFDTEWRLCMRPTPLRADADVRMAAAVVRRFVADGSHTAFFDAYLRLVDYLEAAPRFRKLAITVFMFTDGANNLPPRAGMQAVPEAIRRLDRCLHCITYLVNIGGDVPRAKRVANMINAEFCDARYATWQDKTVAICEALKPAGLPAAKEERPLHEMMHQPACCAAPPSVLAPSPAAPAAAATTLSDSAFPAVPTHPVEGAATEGSVIRTRRELA